MCKGNWRPSVAGQRSRRHAKGTRRRKSGRLQILCRFTSSDEPTNDLTYELEITDEACRTIKIDAPSTGKLRQDAIRYHAGRACRPPGPPSVKISRRSSKPKKR